MNNDLGHSWDTKRIDLTLVNQALRLQRENKFDRLFPDQGPRRRELYPRHLEFLAAGSKFRERLFMAGNRTGKTETGAYEMTCHLTGRYPEWWEGKRFEHPIIAWAAGTTNQKVREILQEKLLGADGQRGTGMIPSRLTKKVVWKQGPSAAPELVHVRHTSGGISVLGFKSYEQGRRAFEGTAQQVIWLDEEPDAAIYTECLYRTATTDGIVYTTFTPLLGMTDVVKSFLEPEDEVTRTVKHVTTAGWEHAPHLNEKTKRELMASTPLHQRDARMKGTPQLGAGAIYPLAESDILVTPIQIEPSWPRLFALDVGWNRTAAIWLTHDRQRNIWYAYHEYYRSQAEPVIHAQAIKAPGDWIPGVADPASIGASQADGRSLIDTYRGLGLQLQPAENTVETGIFEVWQALSTGQLKIFNTLANWMSEFRKYHRDERGRIIKADDHLMDCTRYAWMERRRAGLKPIPRTSYYEPRANGPRDWMA